MNNHTNKKYTSPQQVFVEIAKLINDVKIKKSLTHTVLSDNYISVENWKLTDTENLWNVRFNLSDNCFLINKFSNLSNDITELFASVGADITVLEEQYPATLTIDMDYDTTTVTVVVTFTIDNWNLLDELRIQTHEAWVQSEQKRKLEIQKSKLDKELKERELFEKLKEKYGQ